MLEGRMQKEHWIRRMIAQTKREYFVPSWSVRDSFLRTTKRSTKFELVS